MPKITLSEVQLAGKRLKAAKAAQTVAYQEQANLKLEWQAAERAWLTARTESSRLQAAFEKALLDLREDILEESE
jgi:hypothetical protein